MDGGPVIQLAADGQGGLQRPPTGEHREAAQQAPLVNETRVARLPRRRPGGGVFEHVPFAFEPVIDSTCLVCGGTTAGDELSLFSA